MRFNPTRYLSILAIALWASTASGGRAPEVVEVSSAVPVELEVVATGLGTAFSRNLGAFESRDVYIAEILVSSNSPNGFQVTLTSLNEGKLLRDGGDINNSSDTLQYSLDFERGAGGRLGAVLPNIAERRNLKLTSGSQSIRFDDGIDAPTVSSAFELEIHTPQTPGLFAGSYSDTVTITVEDL